MRVLTIVHQPDAGPGIFAEAISAAGHVTEVWEPTRAEAGDAIWPVPPPDLDRYGAILTFGGGMHPDQEDAHPWLTLEKQLLSRALEREVPLLAVCLGAELLAEAAGATPRRAVRPEIGWYPVSTTREAQRDPLLERLPTRFEALEWHSYESPLPPGAVALAASETCLQAYRVASYAWGIQFHAEVTLETFESWLDSYREDPDAVELGIDPERLRLQTRAAIRDWNRIGYELCARFLQLADGVRERGAG